LWHGPRLLVVSLVKKKDSYLQAQFYRIKARRGPKKAIMAVAASILTAIYHMLKDGTMYKDLGRNHFDRRSTDQQKSAWSNVWPTLATLWRSSRSPPRAVFVALPSRRVCGTARVC
jgi:hypothetical protein